MIYGIMITILKDDIFDREADDIFLAQQSFFSQLSQQQQNEMCHTVKKISTCNPHTKNAAWRRKT